MKHNNKLKTFGYAVAALLVAAPSLGFTANSPSDRYFNKRAYIGAGLGISNLEPESTTDAVRVTENSDTSFSLHLGADINPRFALDAYAANMGTAEVSFLGSPAGGVDYQVYGLSLITYLTNSGSRYTSTHDDDGRYQREGLSTYLRLGVGTMRNDTDQVTYNRDHDEHFVIGLGLEHGWENGVALRAEMTSYDKDAMQLSMSLLKRFGEASYAAAAAATATAVSAQSTPEPIAPAAAKKMLVLLEDPIILFATNQKRVQSLYVAVLERLADTLKANPDVMIKIDGHADWVGAEEYNMKLSLLRAASVRDFLAANGLDPTRVVVEGHGELKPIADNNSEQGRARNRRIEISRLR